MWDARQVLANVLYFVLAVVFSAKTGSFVPISPASQLTSSQGRRSFWGGSGAASGRPVVPEWTYLNSNISQSMANTYENGKGGSSQLPIKNHDRPPRPTFLFTQRPRI